MIEVSSEQSISQFCMDTECCCRCCCCSVMLYCCCCCNSSAASSCCLFAILCRVAKFVAGSLNLVPVFSSSSFKRDVFFMYPLAVLCRIYGLDLPTSSVITDMRGAKAAVSPPRRSPPCINIYMHTYKRKKKNLTLNRLCFIDKQYFARACCLQLYGRNPVRKRIL